MMYKKMCTSTCESTTIIKTSILNKENYIGDKMLRYNVNTSRREFIKLSS